jgi:hypothetical protein
LNLDRSERSFIARLIATGRKEGNAEGP